jgi:hypothetical protein
MVIRADLSLTTAYDKVHLGEIGSSPEYGLPHLRVQRPVGFGVQSRVLDPFCDGLALNVAGGGQADDLGSE